MRRSGILCGLCVVVSLAAAASAAPLVYERFENSAVGTIVGGVTFSTDVIAPMIDAGGGPVANQYTAVFDGAGGTYVTHGTGTQVTSTSFTVEAFIRLDSTANYSTIASDWNQPNDDSWFLIVTPTGQLRFDVSHTGQFVGANALYTPAGVIQADKWYHVAAVSDGSHSSIHVDGVEVASMDRPNPGIYTGGIGNLKIGNVDGWGGGNPPRPFDGRIDELRIDNGTALDRSGFIKSDRVRAWVQAEDGTPSNPAVTVANTDAGPDGTAIGGVAYSADVASPRVAAPDMIRSNNVSLQFDGNTGTYAGFGNTMDLELGATGGFTVEALIKPTTVSGFQIITAEWDDSSSNAKWALALQGDQIRFDTTPTGSYNGGNRAMSPAGTIAAGQWQHVAGVYDGVHSRIYVDGRLVAEIDRATDGLFMTDTTDMRIGGAASFTGGGYQANFGGGIDEVRVTQRALDPMGFLLPVSESAWVQAEDGVPPAAATTVTNSEPGPDALANGAVAYSADVAVSHVATAGDGRPNAVSLALDGNVGTYVEFPEAADIQPGAGGGFTVEAFIKPTDVSGYQVVASEWDDGAPGAGDPNQRVWALTLTGDQIRFDTSPTGPYVGGNKAQTDVPGGVVQAGQWHHVAGVYDQATNTNKVYVNGTLVATQTLASQGVFLNDIANLRIGAAHYFGSQQANFGGVLDEVRITQQALAPGQFLMPHNTAWITAEDGTPPAAAATVSNALPGPSGTAHGGVSYSSDVPGTQMLAPGVDRPNGVSLAFDGQPGTYVEFDGSLDVRPGDGGGFTIEAFIKPGTVSGTQVVASEWWDGFASGSNRDVWGLALEGSSLRFLSSPDGEYYTGNNVLTPSGSIVAGEWQHIAAVYDGATTRLYIDYALAAEGVLTHPGLELFDGAMLRLGAAHHYGGSNGSEQNYLGLIDEFRITDRVLTPAEMLHIPEPGTAALVALGLAGLLRRRRR